MENGMIETGGVLQDVTERIRYYARRSGADMLELGKALTEAKKLVPRGEWEGYVKENAGLERRSAEYFMQAYRKWGTDGGDVAGLNIGQMIALLPASKEEIEKLTAEKNVSSMSTREIKEAVRKAREEEQAKAREGMEAMAQDKLHELARQKEAADRELREAVFRAREEESKKALELKAQNEALLEAIAAKDAGLAELQQAEAQAREAAKAAIEGGRNAIGTAAEAERQAEELRRELAEKDEALNDLQEGYNQMQAELLNARSAIAKGDAERSDERILSSGAVTDAVNLFLNTAGRVPYMHATFAAMLEEEREEYLANVMRIREWAEKSMDALETVTGGGVVL